MAQGKYKGSNKPGNRVSDFLRSTVRRAGENLVERAHPREIWKRIAPQFESWLRQEILISKRELGRAIAHIPELTSAAVDIQEAGVHIDFTDASGAAHFMTIRPKAAHFAPGGAKELTFEVFFPQEEAQGKRPSAMPFTVPVLWAIANAVGRAVWSRAYPLLSHQTPSSHAGALPQIMDWDTSHTARVDLRMLPTYKEMQSNPLGATLLDAMEPRHIGLEEGAIVLRVGIAGFRP